MTENTKRAAAIVTAATIFIAITAFVNWGVSPAYWSWDGRFWTAISFIVVVAFTAAYPGYGD